MGEYLDTDVAFSYLADLKKKFISTYDSQKIQGSYSYQLKNFSEEIHKLADYYIKSAPTHISATNAYVCACPYFPRARTANRRAAAAPKLRRPWRCCARRR